MAENTQPVVYGLHLVKNPKTGKKNVSATVVERGVLTLESISKELAKSTTLTETDMAAAVKGLIEFTMLHVVSGYRVKLGQLGNFYPTLTNKPTAIFKDWTPTRIAGLKCRFEPSQEFLQLLAGASFTKGLGRKNQNKSMADVDQLLEAALAENEPQEEP